MLKLASVMDPDTFPGTRRITADIALADREYGLCWDANLSPKEVLTQFKIEGDVQSVNEPRTTKITGVGKRATIHRSGQIQGISKEEIDKTVAPLEELRARLEQKKIEFTVGMKTEAEGASPISPPKRRRWARRSRKSRTSGTAPSNRRSSRTRASTRPSPGRYLNSCAPPARSRVSPTLRVSDRNMDTSDRGIEAVLRKGHRLSALDIDLSIDEQEALKGRHRAARTESAIEALDGEIANNASDMGCGRSGSPSSTTRSAPRKPPGRVPVALAQARSPGGIQRGGRLGQGPRVLRRDQRVGP